MTTIRKTWAWTVYVWLLSRPYKVWLSALSVFVGGFAYVHPSILPPDASPSLTRVDKLPGTSSTYWHLECSISFISTYIYIYMLIISINSISCYLFIQFIFQYFILWTLWTPEFRTTMLFYIHIPGSSWFHISEGSKWAVGSTSRKRRCCQVFALRWWLPGGHVFSVPSLPSLGKAWRKVSGWCFSLFCLSGMEHSVPMVAHIYIYISYYDSVCISAINGTIWSLASS